MNFAALPTFRTLFVALGIPVFVALGMANASAQAPHNNVIKRRIPTPAPEFVPRTGHSGNVLSLASSPDGKLLVSGDNTGEISFWEMSSGRMLRSLHAFDLPVAQIVFAPDGRSILTRTFNGEVKSWDVLSGQQLQKLPGATPQGLPAVLSPDGRWLAGYEQDRDGIAIREVPSGKLAGVIQPQALTFSPDPAAEKKIGPLMNMFVLAFSPDGRLLAGVDVNQQIFLYEVPSLRLVNAWYADDGLKNKPPDLSYTGAKGIKALSFSQDSHWLASGAQDGTVVISEISAGQKILSIKADSVVSVLAFSPDGSQLATAGNGISSAANSGPQIWDLHSGKPAAQIHAGIGTYSELFLPNGKTLAAGSSLGALGLFDAHTGNPVLDLQGRGVVDWMEFSSNAKKLLMLAPDGSLISWDLSQGAPTLMQTASPAHEAVLNPSGKRLALYTFQTTILDLPSGKQTAQWYPLGPQNLIGMAPADDLLFSVAYLGSTIHVTDSQTGKEIRKTQLCGTSGRQMWLQSPALSPDGRWLAGICHSELPSVSSVGLWDAETWKSVKVDVADDPSIRSVEFSPDSKTLAIGSEADWIKLASVETGAVVRTLPGQASTGVTLAFSSEGKWLASGGRQGLEVWDAASGNPVFRSAELSDVRSLRFTPDSQILLAAGWDGSMTMWNREDGELLGSLSLWNKSDWLVVTPDGLFDGSPSAWSRSLWRFNHNTYEVTPVESFFNEYFYPGLLAEILSGKRPKASMDIASKDRRQPQIQLSAPNSARPSQAQTIRNFTVKLSVAEGPADAQHRSGSGVRDVRLFRNGTLVHIWHGDVPLRSGKTSLEAPIPIIAGENRISAYAFNRDNIKSGDSTLSVTGSESLRRAATAYILAIGVNQYANADFNLKFAVSDAQALSSALQKQLLNDKHFAKVVILPLLDAEATKANILLALARLAGTQTGALPAGAAAGLNAAVAAQPEDAVFIYFAGHGGAVDPHFFLIPHDLGYLEARSALDGAGSRLLESHGVSDGELQNELEHLDSSEIVLLIDACESGRALDSDAILKASPADFQRLKKQFAFRGPMNSGGLAQLGYEKGMYILTAGTGYQAALELPKLQHGLLTYALGIEGLGSNAADSDPKDGRVDIREWLNFAVRRVPELELEQMETAHEEGREVPIIEGETPRGDPRDRSLQHPRVFFRREAEVTPFIIAILPPQ